MSRNSFTLLLIIISHLFPMYGLLHLGWSPFQTILYFNIETFIMILFFELSVLARIGTGKPLEIIGATFFLLPVMIIFNMVHFLISSVMFGTTGSSLTWLEVRSLFFLSFFAVLQSIVFVTLRHLMDFIGFIQRKEYKKKIITKKPNPNYIEIILIRIFFMQFTIIFGGLLGKASGHLEWGVSLIVIFQFLFSLILYKKSLQLENLPATSETIKV